MTESNLALEQGAEDSTGTTNTSLEGNDGQSVSSDSTTTSGSSAEESFFDPASIQDSPELQQAYKQMQGQFTKRMQDIRDNQQKIDAYNQFTQDPEGVLRQLASQYGYKIDKGETSQEFEPKTWDEVITRTKEETRAELLKELAPYLDNVKSLQKNNIEQYLNNNYPDWRTYEDDMMGLIKSHPTLSHDPDKLYRLAVPEHVWEARATKKAMSKLQNQTKASEVTGTSTTQRQASKKTGKLSFNEAVEFAQAELAKQGLTPPRS